MVTTLLHFIGLAVIAFFPIMLWGYIFSYIDDNVLNKKRFFIGVVGGGISVVPILYMDKLIDLIPISYIHTFYFVSQIEGFFSSIQFGISLSLFLAIIIFGSLILSIFIKKTRELLSMYMKNIVVFFIGIVCMVGVVYLGNFLLPYIQIPIGDPVVFRDIVFNSFKLIVFYYLLVSFIEESSKHFNFLQSSGLYVTSVQNGVLYAIFVALGFSFIENLLYLYTHFQQIGPGKELMTLYFMRSIFSIMVHMLCSSVVAYYFSKALLKYRSAEISIPYMKLFLYGLAISIILHLVFDLALTLGFGSIIFFYFIGGYLYITHIFYEEEEIV